jgi:hypothetical protein
MKSKLLQKRSPGLNRPHDAVDGQHENIEDSSELPEPTRNHATRSTWLLTPRRENSCRVHRAVPLLVAAQRLVACAALRNPDKECS